MPSDSAPLYQRGKNSCETVVCLTGVVIPMPVQTHANFLQAADGRVTMQSMSDEIVLTAAEKDGLYFIPSAVGGKQVDEAMQLSLQAKGLITQPLANGRRGVTRLGDRVRQAAVKSRVEA